jgi:hypothetical protein
MRQGRPKRAAKNKSDPKVLERERQARLRRAELGLCRHCKAPATVGRVCFKHWLCVVAFNHLGTRRGWRTLQDLWVKQGARCAYTGEALVPGEGASLDHIVPFSKGGSFSADNVQWVSYRVNRMKTDMTHAEFIRMCVTIAIRHIEKELA